MRDLIKCKTCSLQGYAYCIHPEAHQQSKQTNPKPSLNTTPGSLKQRNSRRSPSKKKSKAGKSNSSIVPAHYAEHSKKVKVKMIISLKRRNIKKPYSSIIRNECGFNKKSNLEGSANIKGRLKFQKFICQEFDKAYRGELCSKGFEFHFVTFCDDRFVTLDRSPEVDLFFLKEKVRAALRQKPECDYIAFVDVNLATNFPRARKGASLMFHVHALVWRPISKKGKPETLFTSGLLPGFKSIMTNRPVLSELVDDLSTLNKTMAYVAKPPFWGKTITTSLKGKNGKPRINMENYALPKTMRFLALARILSPYAIDEMIISKGLGKQIVKSSLAKLREINPNPPTRRLSRKLRLERKQLIEKAWINAQTGQVKVRYDSPKIRVSRLDPPLSGNAKNVEKWLPGAVEEWLARRKPDQL